ncbi:hypothetical protein LMG33810_000653 [Carnimonas sp. LMG 33810]
MNHGSFPSSANKKGVSQHLVSQTLTDAFIRNFSLNRHWLSHHLLSVKHVACQVENIAL